MINLNVIPVILCGGSGTRLWPLSRAGFPKQFLMLSGKKTLFQQAVERTNHISDKSISVGETLVITGEEHRFIALEQLKEISFNSTKLILEPVSKNTAPALTLAALQTLKEGVDPILVVSPADHVVKNNKAFICAIRRAVEVASSDVITILGIKPTGPETSFGYIKQSGVDGKFGEINVAKFEEKPNLESAQLYFNNGDYSWNSGIFIMRASVWIKALRTFRKDIFTSTENAFKQSKIDENFIRPDSKLFHKIPSESIDYAVIEKCPGTKFKIKLIPLDAQWSDLGAWDAVWKIGEKDCNGNLLQGDVIVEKAKNNIIYSSHRLVSALGVNNLIIIETADALLIADRVQSQNVKKIVAQLANKSREEHIFHRKVPRPWGWYDTIDQGDRFKVKRIQVNPGASLSLQKHSKRAEHWVVVRGIAEVTCGENVIILKQNESTFIPLGEKHRLSNPTSEILEIIEVQSGDYLDEDDIERIDDGYGRY